MRAAWQNFSIGVGGQVLTVRERRSNRDAMAAPERRGNRNRTRENAAAFGGRCRWESVRSTTLATLDEQSRCRVGAKNLFDHPAREPHPLVHQIFPVGLCVVRCSCRREFKIGVQSLLDGKTRCTTCRKIALAVPIAVAPVTESKLEIKLERKLRDRRTASRVTEIGSLGTPGVTQMVRCCVLGVASFVYFCSKIFRAKKIGNILSADGR